MALETWKWYLNEGDSSNLPYYANTPETIQALRDYVEKAHEKMIGGFFKRFFNKLFHIKPNAYVCTMYTYDTNDRLSIYFRLKDIGDPLKFTFRTQDHNDIRVEMGLGDKYLSFGKHEMDVKGVYEFMKSLANFIYVCVKKKHVYVFDTILDNFLMTRGDIQ